MKREDVVALVSRAETMQAQAEQIVSDAEARRVQAETARLHSDAAAERLGRESELNRRALAETHRFLAELGNRITKAWERRCMNDEVGLYEELEDLIDAAQKMEILPELDAVLDCKPVTPEEIERRQLQRLEGL